MSKSKADDPGPKAAPPAAERRGFFAKAAAVVIGAGVTVFPFLAGLTVVSDPLRRGQRKAQFLRVATLDGLPDDGVPRQFPVIADHHDAWTHYPPEPIGMVFLLREPGAETVRAFNAICPHAGCLVGYLAAKKYFFCPCHASAFALNGDVLSSVSSVSPRALNSLECEVRVAGDGPAGDGPAGDGPAGKGPASGDLASVQPAGAVREVWVKFENFQTGVGEKIPTA